MDRQRAHEVEAAINARAQSEGMPVGVRHVCLACADMLKMSGVGVMLVSTIGPFEPVFASDPLTEQLTELQITVGEGPAAQAAREDRPVLVPDVTAIGAVTRWPVFASEAESLGARAIFAFPLMVGAIAVGVLEVNRRTPGWLTSEETANALLFADAALLVTLDRGAGPYYEGAQYPGPVDRWAEIHQATGMISVQLDTDLTQAFVRLRAYAFAHDRRLADVAHDVVTRRLRFSPDLET